MAEETFSQRHGLLGSDTELLPRDAVPSHVREAIVEFASACYDAKELRRRLFDLLLVPPPTPPGVNDSQTRAEVVGALLKAYWYEVYDYLEDLYGSLRQRGQMTSANELQRKINRYFEKHGVRWKLTQTTLEIKGSDALDAISSSLDRVLGDKNLPVASAEIRAAIANLSRRPSPDITGAMQHSTAALECVVRTMTNYTDHTNQKKQTLGKIISRNPKLLPTPVLEAVHKLWGYASETARHVHEGKRAPTFDEAEFVVGVASSIITFLISLDLSSRSKPS